MNTIVKPVIVPTLLSSKITLWCLIFAGFFVALLLVYNRHDACRAAAEELARPVSTQVATEFFSTRMPPGWKAWTSDGRSVIMYRDPEKRIPFIEIFAQQNPAYAYRALDANKVLMLQHVHDRVEHHGFCTTNSTESVEVLGSETFPVRPGVSAVRLLIDMDENGGEAISFLMGDVYYQIIGFAADDDQQANDDIRSFIGQVGELMTFPDYRESIERPVIDTSLITAEISNEVQAKTARELALWKLFAARAEQEPDAALLPAIKHFREAIQVMARLRREYQLIESDDFILYRRFLDIRKASVSEWFVKFDKLLAMGDLEGAREQARFIISHATLVDESLDRRRAAAKLIEITPVEEGQTEGK